MSLQCGIVGLPNVGKSTLFNALTKAGIAAENYPFCTIEPNVGIVEVPDPRLAKLAAIAKPQKVIPAVVEFVDIAGLVAGASKGEGLGNQFLANIRETNAIANVVRCFVDPNVIHVANKVDPIADIEVIHTELALADMQSVEKAIQRIGRNVRAGEKDAVKLLAILEKRPAHRQLRAEAVQVLVSLMGFSPETTVISTAILRPQSLVVVLSERAERSYDRAHEFLTAHKILRPSQIERIIIPPIDRETGEPDEEDQPDDEGGYHVGVSMR